MNKKIIIATVIPAILFGGYMSINSPSSDDMYNRLWVDKYPQTDTEMIKYKAFLGDDEGFGIQANSSQWHVDQDKFIWESDEGTVKVYFPQTNQTKDVEFKVSDCNAPIPFTMCLDLTIGDVKERLYSNEELEMDSSSTVQEIMNSFIK